MNRDYNWKTAYFDLKKEYADVCKDLRRLKARPKRTMQFSQKMTLISAVFSMVFVVGINAANFALLWYGKQPMPQEAVTAMTIYGGITSTLTFGGYCALSGFRDCSLNKAKIERGLGKDEKKD